MSRNEYSLAYIGLGAPENCVAVAQFNLASFDFLDHFHVVRVRYIASLA